MITQFIINSSALGELKLLGGIAETYDDNVTNSQDKESDFITNLMIGSALLLEGRTQTIDLTGHIYQDLYYDRKELNRNYQDLSLNYKKMFSELDNLSITDIFSHYPEARDFQSSFARNDKNIYSNSVNLNLVRYFFNYFLTSVNYNNTIYKSSEDRNYSIANGAGVSLGYSTNSLNDISLFYNYINARLTQEENGEDKRISSNIHNMGLSCKYYLTNQLHALGRIGLEYLTSSIANDYKPFFSLSIIDDLDINNSLNFTISKRYEIVYQANSVFDSWIFSLDFTRQLSSLLAFSLTLFYENGKRVSDLTESKSKLYGTRTSISYYLSINLFISGAYTYTKSKTSQTQPVDAEIEYNKNQLQVALNAEF